MPSPASEKYISRGGSGHHPPLKMDFHGVDALSTSANYIFAPKSRAGAVPAPKNNFLPAPTNSYCSSGVHIYAQRWSIYQLLEDGIGWELLESVFSFFFKKSGMGKRDEC